MAQKIKQKITKAIFAASKFINITTIKRVLQWIVNLINRNTIMDSSVVACLKSAFVIVPLGVGLLTYDYSTEPFCRALFLYSAALTFDMGLRVTKSIGTKKVGIILHIFQIFIFFTALLLSVFGIIGFLNNSYLLVFLEKHKWVNGYIYPFIYFQSAWYLLEFAVLSIGEILLKIISRTSIRISQKNDSVHNL